MADPNNHSETSRRHLGDHNALIHAEGANLTLRKSTSVQPPSVCTATPPDLSGALRESSPGRLRSEPAKVSSMSLQRLLTLRVPVQQRSTPQTTKEARPASTHKPQGPQGPPLTPEGNMTPSNSMPPPSTPVWVARPQPSPLTPITPPPKPHTSMPPPSTPVKALRRPSLGGQNGGDETAHEAFSSPIVRNLPLSEMQTPFPPLENGQAEKFQIGQAVFLLDSRGNSVLCSRTINPMMMHMAQFSTAEPNSVGKGPNLHQLDAPNVFLIERRFRWISADGEPQAPGGANIVYKLVPKEGGGRERLVPFRNLIVEVRFTAGDWTYYVKEDDEGNKTRLEALVQGSDVVERKRTYTIYLATPGTVVSRVRDEDLEEHPYTDNIGMSPQQG